MKLTTVLVFGLMTLWAFWASAANVHLESFNLASHCRAPLRCEPGLWAHWQMPVKKATVSSCFGQRKLLNKFENFHEGVDLFAPMNTPVRSVARGKVIWRGFAGCSGRSIVVEHHLPHRRIVLSLYKHLHEFNAAVGETVSGGQVIASSGASGRKLKAEQSAENRGCVSGPHLHLELRLVNSDLDSDDVEDILYKYRGHMAGHATALDPRLFLPTVRRQCGPAITRDLASLAQLSSVEK